jgi:hypothetical protein
MTDVSVGRLDVSVTGVSPAVAEAAVRALPLLLAARLTSNAGEVAGETVTLDAAPTADRLADALADHVAGVIRRHATSGRG